MSYEIQAEVRQTQGTGASRRLRNAGKVPAVLYGEGTEPLAIAVEHRAMFYALEKESFHTALIALSIDGKIHNVIVRDFQMHPFKQQVQHIDFQVVDLNKPVKIRVPVHVLNAEISPAVKLQGGRVSLLANAVEVSALPKNMPESLVLDVAKVNAGDILHLSDIPFPEGVESVSLKRGDNLAIASASGKKR
ncbi:50S ribosomal protein L25/general stress protein Ctc [Stenoxybacter acetivorans]|uniref:50S ribosomal protein L25/general stress protein Ctc n=1 Tax=Stenoxybacter acetivorans TaxID=422441 RepID=UPI00055C27D8|nr:50S ribosomal protein L25/general stress protein Ctc [Stenoxybacter acetivorans]